MAKTKENAGTKAAVKAKRASAKAKKTRAAKDAAAVKAARDAEAQREVDENAAGDAETRPEAVEAQADHAPEVDEPAPKKRKQGRQKGYNTPKAEIERQEQIKEAMEYRLMGYTYRQIAEQMEVAPSTAYKWVSAGLAEITQETAEELRRVMMEQCHQIIQKLMPLMDETAPRDVLDGILKVQAQQMKLAGVLQGNGISVSIGKPGAGNSEEDIIVRIKADAPVLKPDEPVPAQPVLSRIDVRIGGFFSEVFSFCA